MDTNEIMVNEEVIEATEEVIKTGSRKGIKVAAGIGLTVFGGIFVYKYIAKPIAAKIKTCRNKKKSCEQDDSIDNADFIESEYEEAK